MPARNLVVFNPKSRSGATGRGFASVEAKLRKALGALEIEQTRGPRDAERIVREGVRAGCERIIVAGGDGTTGEVVTGLLSAQLGDRAEIALLPLGTGGDLMRTLGIPRDLDAAITSIAEGKTRRLDAVAVHYRSREGAEAHAYSLNVCSLGISGLVDELVNRAPKRLGGTASFLIGTLRALFRYRCPGVELQLDGEPIHSGPLMLATAANGRYFGGGMCVAPEARPDDGLLEVVVIPGLSRSRMLANLPGLYRGTHVERPQVSVRRGRRLEARSLEGEEPVWLDVDGEPLGQLPARFEIIPGAIRWVGGSS